MPDQLPCSPAADRNKEPILAVLRRILGPRGAALEIASGTGQHAAWFAAGLPNWRWQPTEADAALLPVIEARVAEAGLANVLPPLHLDVMASQWPTPDAPFAQRFDAGGVKVRFGKPTPSVEKIQRERRGSREVTRRNASTAEVTTG